METKDLQMFVDAARAGNFAEVARQRGIDASLVSRSIASLEQELGFRLFQRTTRRVALTESGQHYFDKIIPLLEEMEEARDLSRNLSSMPKGTLRVTTSTAFGQIKIIPLLGELRTQCPELSIELVLNDANVDLVAERIDVAIRLGPRLDTGFVGFPLLKTRYQVCASPGYLKREGHPGTPQELKQRSCLLFPFQGFRSRWLYKQREDQIEEVAIRGDIVISSALGLLQATLAGLGPCLLADWLVEEKILGGELIDLFPDYQWTATDFETAAWLLYPSRDRLPLKTRIFVDFIKHSFGLD